MTELHKKTLVVLREKLEAGACSSEDIIRSYLAAIERDDPKIRAYVELDAEQALEDARTADARRAAGERGKLLGLPVAVKDLLNVAGQSCRCGSKLLEGYTSPYDATTVARIRAEGGILLGRVNMDEFGMGSSTENSSMQVTCNPWNLDHVPGGSSGGSAAAVSADLALVSLGSDTGGSIRQPASFSGCVGIKPTYGRVSRYGLTAYASSLDQVGVLAKCVADAAVTLEVIAGHDAADSTSLDVPVPDYSAELGRDLKGLRLGIPAEFFGEGLDPAVEEAVRTATEACRALGAELVEVQLPNLRYAISTYYIIATAEASANLARFDGVRYGARVEGDDPIDLYGKTRAAGFGTEVKRRIILGTYVLSSGYHDAYYLKAQKARTLIRADFEKAFEGCDALLAPVAPTAAYRIGEMSDDPLQMYLGDICTVPINLAGICGMSVPCGFTPAGLPVGLQIIGPALQESTLFRVGHAYESATDWHTRKPGLDNGKEAADV